MRRFYKKKKKRKIKVEPLTCFLDIGSATCRCIPSSRNSRRRTEMHRVHMPKGYTLVLPCGTSRHYSNIQFSTQSRTGYIRVYYGLYECVWLYFLSIVELTNNLCTKHKKKSYYRKVFSFAAGFHCVRLLVLPCSEQNYPLPNRMT